jgi:hypothetical protein
VHTPTARSIVDALYRGDAVGAKKVFVDYVGGAKDPAEQKARAQSLQSSIQAANPLKLGSTSNKDFVAGFWKWAQAGHNISQSQMDDFRDLMNTYSQTLKAARLAPQELRSRRKARRWWSARNSGQLRRIICVLRFVKRTSPRRSWRASRLKVCP